MKSQSRILPTTLASLILFSSGIGIDAAQAQFSDRRRPRSFPEAAEQWGYECKRQDSGYFCRANDRSDRDDDWDDQDEDRGNDDWRFSKGRLYQGQTIRTTAKNRDRLVIRKNDNMTLTLYVDENIRGDDTDRVIIPRNSRIEGRLRPRDGGTQFEAERLTLPNGRRYDLDASSEIVYPNRQIASRRTTTSDAAKDILSTILGDRRRDDRDDDIDRGSNQRGDLIVVYPDRDLDLRLEKDLRID
jgi:hypothetical protein